MLIGIAPAEYPLVMIGFRLVESLSHTNVRVSLGWIGKLLLVGPQYHRLHHAIEHARAPFDRTMGCNFAVILPVWDALFRTWRKDHVFPATGVAALAEDAVSCGYVRHQLEGFRRLGAVVAQWFDRRRPGFAAGLDEKRQSPAGDVP
jgi:sterol desaturase/sphingolipid hydroxylase (fatty acid hydroxylase superfamily)